MPTKWLLLFLVLFAVCNAHGHILSVDQLSLIEEDGGQYLLKANASPVQLRSLGLPILPDGCRWVQFKDDKEWQAQPGLRFVCDTGALTAEDQIVLPWPRNGVLVTALWHDGSTARQFFLAGPQGIVIEMAVLRAGSGSWTAAVWRYTALGVEHILQGIDHLLFVMGLLLLVRDRVRLAWTITAFTAAHSITLALSVLGHVSLPSAPVEAIIALSIVFVAVENVHALRGRAGVALRRPWLVSFGFGLIHGLGFAGALKEIGLPQSELPPALLFFNLGVELGQLAVVGLWLGCAWILARIRFVPPRRLRWLPHYALGITASYWLIERIFAIFA